MRVHALNPVSAALASVISVCLGATAFGLAQDQKSKGPPRHSAAPKVSDLTPEQIAEMRERDIHSFALRLEQLARMVREQQEEGNTKLVLEGLREIEFVTEGLGGKLTKGKWDEYTGRKHPMREDNMPPPPAVIPPSPPPR